MVVGSFSWILIGIVSKPVGAIRAFQKIEVDPAHNRNNLTNQGNKPQKDIPAGATQVVEPFNDEHQDDPNEEQHYNEKDDNPDEVERGGGVG